MKPRFGWVVVSLTLVLMPGEFLFSQHSFTLTYVGEDRPPRGFIAHKRVKRPRVGLALSGGGARGLAQIGVLEVFEEHHIPIDLIVGTSMGAMVGGLYAAGYTPQEIWQIARRMDWDHIMVDTPPRTSLFIGQKQERDRYFFQMRFSGAFKPYIPAAYSPGLKLTNTLTELTLGAPYGAMRDFDELGVPFRAIATDLVTGRKVVLKDGDLAEAMRASASVPVLFNSVEREGMLLVDGGLVDNLPVEDVRAEGVDLVIAVDTISKLRRRDELGAPWEVADQVTAIMQRDRNERVRREADVLIQVEAGDRPATDFSDLDALRQAGRQAALQKLGAIQSLLLHKEREGKDGTLFVIKSIHLVGHRGAVDDTPLLKNLDHLSDTLMTAADIEKLLATLYATGRFADLRAELGGDSTLSVEVVDNPTLRGIRFEGNAAFSDSTLQSCMASQIGSVINANTAREDLQALIKFYRKNGYSLARIRDVGFDSTSGMVTLHIDEGRISDIRIEGNPTTRRYIILREFPLKRGDIFNLHKANQGLSNLHSTGLFDYVLLTVLSERQGPVVLIKLREKKFGLLRTGLRYDDERKGRGFIEIAHENLFGLADKGILHAQYGGRDQAWRAQFRSDRIFKTYVTGQANAYWQREKNFTYREGKRVGEYLERRIGVSLSLGQQMRRLGTLSLELRAEQVKLRGLWGEGYEGGTQQINSFIAQSIVDTQDRFPFPRRGRYYTFYYQLASSFLKSDARFFKLYSSLEAYYTLGSHHTLHPRIAWGTGDLTLPYSEQFRLGGEGSFYGFRLGQWVGRQMFLGSLEYRFQLVWKAFPVRTYFHLRYDLGGIWSKNYDFHFKDFVYGFGAKLSFETFLGPIALAYGRARTGQDRVYFLAGYRF